MSTLLRGRVGRPDRDRGGFPARRAVLRWAWRLFRREWRQQIIMVTLLAVAVSVMLFAAAVAGNAPSSGRTATFGTATDVLPLAGDDPHVAADIAEVERRYGPSDVIEDQTLSVPGMVRAYDVRAQDPHGRYGSPMLSLLSGRYPVGPDEVAVTGGVAALFNLHIGDRWPAGSHARRVVGMVENPADLLDQFALVAPGQLGSPTRVRVLFDAPPAAHPCASPSCAGQPQFPGGATAQRWASSDDGATATSIVLVAALVGLIFIGLIARVGFAVIAQRRLRALGMLSAIGATDRDVGLVMVANGAFVGVVGTAVGVAAGLAAWVAYAPHLQAAVERRISWSHLPWWVVASCVPLAVVTAIAAAWRPARSAASVPVVAALSAGPERPPASRRSAAAGVVLLAAGLGCLAAVGGWNAVLTRHNVTVPSPLESAGGFAGGLTGWTTGERTPLLLGGIAASAGGVLLLAPLAVAPLTAIAWPAPVSVRLTFRNLTRYRQRSGAVLAVITFTVLLAVSTAILTTARSSDPFTPVGPNLAANQIVIYAARGPATLGPQGLDPTLTPAQQHTLQTNVDRLAAALHAQFAVLLYSAGRLDPGANTPEAGTNQRAELWQVGQLRQFPGPLYVATPALLGDYGIDPSQIAPDSDLLTSRSGLATVPHVELDGEGNVFSRHTPAGHEVSGSFHLQCPPASCIASPKIQTIDKLPTGTSSPSTVITEHAVRALGQHLVPDGWLVQTNGPLTAAQKDAARQAALTDHMRIEVASGAPDLSTLRTGIAAAGVFVALAVLVMTVGLIRSETTSDMRILTAAGAGSLTRRALAAATAGTLGLLGAVLGTSAAYAAIASWAHGDLAATLGAVPVAELLEVLAGMPVVAAVGGWLLGGKEPALIARRPLE